MSQITNQAFQATVHIYHSRRDTYGNVYWAMVYVDHMSGKRVAGTISGGRSDITWAFPTAYHCDTELPIRKFNKTTSGWGYAGCTCEQLQAYVQKGLQ